MLKVKPENPGHRVPGVKNKHEKHIQDEPPGIAALAPAPRAYILIFEFPNLNIAAAQI